MRPILYAFVLLLALVGGIVAWLEWGDAGPGATATLEPAAPPAIAEDTAPADEPAPDDGDEAEEPAASAPLPATTTGTMPAAPKPELLEPGVEGRIARIGRDGAKPWRVYAKPFETPESGPMVAVVVTDMGLKAQATAHAIAALPGAVSLVFSPYADDLAQWTERARTGGHETLAGIPMEPAAYPANDPGDRALLVAMPTAELSLRLRWSLSRFAGYVGGAGIMGERFVAAPGGVRPLMRELSARGLMYLDTAITPDSLAKEMAREMGVPFAEAHLRLDDTPTAGAIDGRLSEAVALARREGAAVALAQPYPITVERIALWAETLEGATLVPVSAVARRSRTE